MPLRAGDRLGSFDIVAPLGEGGMGEVYRARDARLGRDVALKVLRPELAADADAVARFAAEARAAAALSHPNIVALYDIGQHDGTAYVVTELLDGETLRERMRAGAVPIRKALDYARQIADGLGAVHQSGIVHRDLKPENVFVTSSGRIKILDFGIAQMAAPAAMAAEAVTLAHTRSDLGARRAPRRLPPRGPSRDPPRPGRPGAHRD
jgi:eukaryotic-like serine/threonine-protein kinase